MTDASNITPPQLHRVRLELARDHDFPEGSRERGYDFIAPLDGDGRISLDGYKHRKDRCRVRRFWAGEADEVAHIVHKRHGWAFHYDIHGDPSHDEAGFRFDTHSFKPGEYVSIKEQDGQLRTFRVVSVIETD